MTPEEMTEEIEGLVRAYGGKLRGYLRRRGYPGDVADDALADALLAVWVQRQQGKPLDNPSAFLFTVARNSAADRRGRHAVEVADSDAVDKVPAPDALGAVEISADLHTALGQLPPRQREVVELRHLGDSSVSETAQALGMAEGTVGPTRTAGLRNLRRIMGEGYGEEEA